MKHLILPALSLALLAIAPAQAQTSSRPYLQIAADKPGREHPGGQTNPVIAPGGAGAHAPADHARKQGAGRSGGGVAGGGQGAGSTGGRNRAGAGAAAAGGGRGAGSMGGRNRGGAGGIDRTGGGILLPGTPVGGHNAGGAATGGGHAGATVFGKRPPNWNQYPRKFDRGTYQRNFNAPRHYHWQSYHRPKGYYYRRWVFGQIFPKIFWAADYWLTDYWMFDLPVPPYGYVWVRYGDDALLINKRTGEVLQVVYDLFD